ncbi:MAG: VWA domain-containing protein, partial [Nitrospiraceae bacterium]
MKKQHAMMLFVILTVMSVLSPGMVQGQSRNNIDVALVIDSSGSMKKTDPNSLRIPAAKLFISLLGGGDRAAVLSFSDQGYQLAGLKSLDSESDKEMLLHAAEKINSRGLYTNLYSAFSKGMEVLLHSREEDRDQIIILMSDGMIDVGNSAEDEQLLTMLKSDLSLELKNNNVKVYSIAFTDQSDRKLLEKLSKQTGGFYNLAMTDRDFHLIFTSIFESLKSPEMLPMDRNAFLIDPSVQEVTIVVSKESPDSDILIHAPDGQQYSGKKRYSGISWFESDNFDMITIQRPVEGRWKILYSTDENNKAYIITDLALETNFEQLYAVFGENLAIKAWLEKEGSVIREGEVLETTEFFIELNNPDGKVSNLKPLNKGDGIFHKTITPFKDGNYRLRVVAKGQTFEREKAFLFNVANLQESKEDLKAAREARLADKKDQGVSEVQEEPINWLKISFQFLLINLFIGLLVVMYMKRQCIKDFKLLHRAFNRFKGETLQQTQEPVSGESGAAPANEINETVKNKNADIKKEKIILDEADPEAETEGNNIEGMKEPVAESSPVEEAESEAYVEEKSEENELSKLDAEIQRLEKLKQQDTDDQPAAVTKITAPENKEVAESREQDLAEDKEDEEEHVDDLWADALNERAEAEDDTEKGESSKPEHAVPDEAVTEDVKETEEEQQA